MNNDMYSLFLGFQNRFVLILDYLPDVVYVFPARLGRLTGGHRDQAEHAVRSGVSSVKQTAQH